MEGRGSLQNAKVKVRKIGIGSPVRKKEYGKRMERAADVRESVDEGPRCPAHADMLIPSDSDSFVHL